MSLCFLCSGLAGLSVELRQVANLCSLPMMHHSDPVAVAMAAVQAVKKYAI